MRENPTVPRVRRTLGSGLARSVDRQFVLYFRLLSSAHDDKNSQNGTVLRVFAPRDLDIS